MSFNNTEPRSREERLAAQSREKLEKALLVGRRGCFGKYGDAGSPIVPESPAAPAYSDEANRFRRDAAAEMREAKLEAWRRQQVRRRAHAHACARAAAPRAPLRAPADPAARAR
jgi:hypothetical protein